MFTLKNIPVYYILILAPVLFHVDNCLTGITAGFIGMMLLILCSVAYIGDDKYRFGRLDMFFLLFVIWYTGRLVGSGPPAHVWWLMLGGGAIILYAYTRDIASKVCFFDILFVAGIFQVGWYFAQFYNILPSYNYFYLGTGGFSNPAILAILVVSSCLAGIYGCCREQKRFTRFVRWVGVLLLLICLMMLGSRASWVGLAAGVLWIVLARRGAVYFRFINSKRSKYRWGIYILLVGFTLVVSGGIMYIFYQIHPASVNGRFLIWQVAGQMFSESPWFGCGSFSGSYMLGQATWFEMHPDSSLVHVAANTGYAFNEFLRVACETGIVGLVLFLSVVITALYYSARGSRIACYAGGILVSILGFGLFSYPLSVELIVAITVILLAIIAGETRQGIENTTVFNRGIVFIPGMLIALFSFILSLEYYHEKRADVLLTDARETASTALTSSGLKVSYEHLKSNPDFVLCYGRMLFNSGEYWKALPVLERGYALRPTSELACDLGKCYQRQRRWEEAGQKYRVAASMVPAYVTPRHLLFGLYRTKGELQRAVEEAEYILTMPVKIVNSSVLRARGEAREFLRNYKERQQP